MLAEESLWWLISAPPASSILLHENIHKPWWPIQRRAFAHLKLPSCEEGNEHRMRKENKHEYNSNVTTAPGTDRTPACRRAMLTRRATLQRVHFRVHKVQP